MSPNVNIETTPGSLEQITPRLRRWGDMYELDGEPLRKIVGRPPKGDLLDQLDQLNQSLAGLNKESLSASDGGRVRKSVGKVG